MTATGIGGNRGRIQNDGRPDPRISGAQTIPERAWASPSERATTSFWGRTWGTVADDAVPAMTRHDFEAWLDHHLDQPVLVEWRTLSGG